MYHSNCTYYSTYYRYGYQGQFAEKDPETGLNSFEARMYDSRIGRWLTTDAHKQYWSSYLAMGNNPTIRADPEGNDDWLINKDGSCTQTCNDGGQSVEIRNEGQDNYVDFIDYNFAGSQSAFEQIVGNYYDKPGMQFVGAIFSNFSDMVNKMSEISSKTNVETLGLVGKNTSLYYYMLPYFDNNNEHSYHHNFGIKTLATFNYSTVAAVHTHNVLPTIGFENLPYNPSWDDVNLHFDLNYNKNSIDNYISYDRDNLLFLSKDKLLFPIAPAKTNAGSTTIKSYPFAPSLKLSDVKF